MIVLFNANIFAQFLPGARQMAMGFAFVSVADDQWSLYYNPAGISEIENLSTGVFYIPAPFGLNELATANAVLTKKFGFGNLGFSFQTYGFDLLREHRISLGFAKNLFQELRLGFKFTYHSINIQNYGNDFALGFDFGLITKLSEKLKLGFTATNLNRPTYGVNKEKLNQLFMAGMSYSPMTNLTFALELEKEVRNPFNFKFGLEYSVIKYLDLRTGYNTEPNNITAGIGIHYQKFSFNYAFLSHKYLGFTHSFGIDYNL